MPRHDIIVVGASAGGVGALSELVATLEPDLEASLFIVLHLAATPPSVLPQILARRTPLPVAHARDGEAIRRGRIYVAPPDHHLRIAADGVQVTRGPRENGHRPAVDPLFRSAASAFGPRVAGVILSGTLDDGTAGLQAVKAAGGTAIVQDPAEALYAGMPQSAVNHSDPDFVLTVEGIGKLLASLAAGGDGGDDQAHRRLPYQDDEPGEGAPSGFTCPECHGVLWDVSDAELSRFRCRVGHAYSAQNLVAEQGKDVENAVWIALRALDERVALTRRLAERARHRGHRHTAAQFDQQADEADRRAEHLRAVLGHSRDETPAAGS